VDRDSNHLRPGTVLPRDQRIDLSERVIIELEGNLSGLAHGITIYKSIHLSLTDKAETGTIIAVGEVESAEEAAVPRRISAVLIAVLVVLLLADCGAGGNGSTSAQEPSPAEVIPSVARDAALAAKVPPTVASDGTLIIGTDASYPPIDFTASDGQTITGLDIDLGTAIAQKLGLTARFVNGSFDGLVPGLSAGRYELLMSAFTINNNRLQEVHMVSYLSAGTSLAVLRGNPDKLSIDKLCGRTVAVQKGTVQVEDLTARSATCTQAGQPAITVRQFQNQTDVTLALTAKRAEAMLADSPVVDYAVQQTRGQLEVVGQPYATAPYGVVVPKNSGEYPQAVLGALRALVDDGTYQMILQKWGVRSGAIPRPELDPAPAGG
jgi:polar amino acid transport system substrate-binding protein